MFVCGQTTAAVVVVVFIERPSLRQGCELETESGYRDPLTAVLLCRFQIVGGGLFAKISTTVVVEAAVVVAAALCGIVRREGGRAHGAASIYRKEFVDFESRSRERCTHGKLVGGGFDVVWSAV